MYHLASDLGWFVLDFDGLPSRSKGLHLDGAHSSETLANFGQSHSGLSLQYQRYVAVHRPPEIMLHQNSVKGLRPKLFRLIPSSGRNTAPIEVHLGSFPKNTLLLHFMILLERYMSYNEIAYVYLY